MKADKIIVPIAILGILGAGSFLLYTYFKNKRKQSGKSAFKPPLSESQLQQTEKSFKDYVDKLKKKQESTTLISNTQPQGFAQSGGFTSPSLVNTQSPIFQSTNQPLGTINYKPKPFFSNVVGQFGIVGI
jgi:hypothetical protein